MYKRKTKDEYIIMQNTSLGWEEICAYETRKEASNNLKLYRENQPEYLVKIVKKRVKL